jgi:Anti-sigma-K factor rskA
MTRPTHEPSSTDLVAGYILDDLSPEETDRLNQALTETPALRGEIAAFGEAFSLIPYDMPIVEPAASLKAKILSAASQSIASTTKATPRSNVVPLPRPNWKQWIPAISTCVAAVSIAALGLNQVQLNRQSKEAIALQQQLETTNTKLERLERELKASQDVIAIISKPGTQSYALAGETSNLQNSRIAKAQIFAKPGDRTVTVMAQALPKLSNSQIYRLWAVASPKAAPTYCGQFRQDDSGRAQWDAPNAACTNQPLQLMITLDGPTDPTTSAGPVVMQSLT